ncbi:hypothetical protein DIPPA_14695 [Diplonema papillatum]|nr:hypothetical protein DIPPA_14695 [Diplonema papillatum]
MPLDEKEFVIREFKGRLGIGLTTALKITDVPSTSPCYAVGLPVGAVLTEVDDRNVRSQNDLVDVLKGIPKSVTEIKIRLRYDDETYKDWWDSIKSNVEHEAASDDEDEGYDPAATEIGQKDAAPAAGGAPPPPQNLPQATLPPYEPVPPAGAAGADPAAANGVKRRWQGSEPSDHDSDPGDEEGDWAPMPKKPMLHAPAGIGNGYAQQNVHPVVAPPPQPYGAGILGLPPSSELSLLGKSYGDVPPVDDGLHPCRTQTRVCHGVNCTLRHYPVETCVYFALHNACHYEDDCRYMHCKANDPRLPYSCHACTLNFSRQFDLNRHMQYAILCISTCFVGNA